ncbi:MAG TPA: MtrB/PioB family outer membrane beta-barrel protein [Burkholderiales bacterium]|nr:MtrB/PioB family outer membrane beta-barrel protein [Burkholderiales bacterium]
MNRKLIPFLIGSLFAATAASAADEDPFDWSGSSVGIGVRSTKQQGGTRNGASATSSTVTGPAAPLAPFTGPEDKAKANEYRDLSDGVIGTIDILGSSKQNYFRLFGENLGYTDQFVNMRGGEYSVYKYQAFQDKMPHNLSWGALTPLSGTGTPLLTNAGPAVVYPPNAPTLPATNPATWNQFDYKLQREVVGGNFEFTANSPWHVRMGYSDTTMQGVRPLSGRLGTSSNNGMIEFGAPVNYQTKDATLDFGYSVKKGSISVNYLNSAFNNSVDTMQWTNFYMLNNLDTTYLPPDNMLNRLGLNATLRELPVNSTLAVRGTWSKLTNNFGVTSGGLLPTNSTLIPPTTGSPAGVGILNTPASSSTFNGDIETKTASLSYTSNWGAGVDSKVFYNYYDAKNQSTLVTFDKGGLLTSGAQSTTCPNPGDPAIGNAPAFGWPTSSNANMFCVSQHPNSLFSYKKQDYGIEGGWRINRQNKVSGGLSALSIQREGREDSEKTDDRRVWAEYKNSMLDDLSARIKAAYVQRHSEFDPARPVGQNPFVDATPAQVPYYYRAYDVSNAVQPYVKMVLDWSPVPLWDASFEAGIRQTNYKDMSYGRTHDDRREYNLTVSYGDPKDFRITALANYEIVEFDQVYRNGNPAVGASPNDAANFDWSTKNTQTNRLAGLIADWVPVERLALKASWFWVTTGGGVHFNSGNTSGAGGFNGGPLVDYVTDNTKKQVLNLKGDYKIDKQWTGTIGYTQEKYDYNDDQMKSYQGSYPYYQYLGGNNNSWFSGAFANPSYRLQVVYLMGTYKF